MFKAIINFIKMPFRGRKEFYSDDFILIQSKSFILPKNLSKHLITCHCNSDSEITELILEYCLSKQIVEADIKNDFKGFIKKCEAINKRNKNMILILFSRKASTENELLDDSYHNLILKEASENQYGTMKLLYRSRISKI